MRAVAIIDDAGVMTGIGTFLRALVTALAEHPAARSWHLVLVLPQQDLSGRSVTWPARLQGGRVEVVRIPARDPRGSADWIEAWLARGEVDVAYFVSPDRVRALNSGMPVVATFHDFNYRRFVTLPRALRRRLEAELPVWIDSCAVCVVSSRFIAGELASYFPAAARRVRVVRLGIPAAVPAAQAPPGLPERYLLTVGWLAPHKNQAVVLEALAELRSRGLALALVCAGPNSQQLQSRAEARDDYVRELHDTAERLGLRPGADFAGLGAVEDRELAALYAQATAVVVPSLYEAGSFPLREAARAGRPVLAADVPALAEEAELLGGNVPLFDPDDGFSLADAVSETIGDPAATAGRVRAARRRVETVFDWRRTAAGYLAAFEAAAAS